ncbi:NfeD family protein [Paenirhodobacter enshiensis]|uniref:NfeD family protein n=1 Tax=Paenirhodobacter enshiensis TaxID=1105367 RepID=UPI003FA313BF
MPAAWIWITAGVVLAFLELLLPGFYLLGFAIGAVATGGLIWAGLIGSVPVALLALAVIAILAWVVLRRALGIRHGQTRIWHRDINEN